MEKGDDLSNIKERINKLKPDKLSRKINNNKLDAFGISVEIVAGVIVGLILGILLDKAFASKPLFLILCLIVGMMASARTIWQKLKNSKNGS